MANNRNPRWLLTRDQTAAVLGVEPGRVLHLMARGELAAEGRLPGGELVFDPGVVLRAAAARRRGRRGGPRPAGEAA